MPVPLAEPPRARSLAELNAEIRALVAAGLVSTEDRREYERLLGEWTDAVQGDVSAAA